MNNYTAAIASYIRYDVVLFNTLEYVMKKDSYDINAYKARREIISQEIENNTPLKNCLDNSGEAGQKLRDKIKELVSLVYSDESTIVKLGPDEKELRVDTSQALTVFDAVLPIHEEIRKIIAAHIAAAQKANAYDEPTFPQVLEAEEYFYRGLVNMLMVDQFDRLFAEYNKARNEAKGAITPQSNFIQNDITRIVNLFHFVRSNASAKNKDYYEFIDPLFALIEMTGGRRDLPEGKNFGDMFTEVKKIVREKTVMWENAWKPLYDAFLKHFTEEIQKLQAEQKATA